MDGTVYLPKVGGQITRIVTVQTAVLVCVIVNILVDFSLPVRILSIFERPPLPQPWDLAAECKAQESERDMTTTQHHGGGPGLHAA